MSGPTAVAVFGSSMTAPGTQEWDEAEQVGSLLAGSDLTVITGGYGGTMEAVSKGAAQVGGHVIGVTVPTVFPGRVGANPYVIEVIEAETLTGRIGEMVERASGAIALPGSIGTATELLVAWNTNHIARRDGGTQFPSVAVGEGWRALVNSLVDSAAATGSDIHHAESGESAVEWMLQELEIL